jgi:hypothetical protein
MPQLVNATSERIADHFVDYLFEQYSDSLHVRRVASWAGLIVLGIEKVASARYVPRARQLRFDYNHQTYKTTFNHHAGGSQRGGIDIIEILPSIGWPEGGASE